MADAGSERQAPIARCAIGALIRDGKVLLVKRSPHMRFYPDVWDLFGGHVEGEESSEDALRREAMEELQVELEAFHLLGTIHDPVEPAEIMVFAVTAWKGEPINAAPDEHTQIGWFSGRRAALLRRPRRLSGACRGGDSREFRRFPRLVVEAAV